MENKSIVGPFLSRMSNTCSQCNVTVHKFAPIYFYKNRRTKKEIAQGVKPQGAIIIHESCLAQFKETQRQDKSIDWTVRAAGSSQDVAQDTEDASEDTTTVASRSPTTPVQPVQPSTGTDLASIIAQSILPLVQSQLEMKLDTEGVQALIDAALKGFKTPVTRIEVSNPAIGTVVALGIQHKAFPKLLKALGARNHKGHRLNFWIMGPAGTGKTSAAEYAADALGLSFAFIPSLTDACELFGYESPIDHTYKETAFYKAWKFGGVHLWDDFDGSDSNAAIRANAPLANGIMTFPNGETVKRHPDCILILTANTWGHGATSDYVGRCKQDAAFLDRFVKIKWEIDEALESATCPNERWVAYVQKVRAKVMAKGLKVLVTPRASYDGAALLEAGLEWGDVVEMKLSSGMSTEQWEMVR